MESVTYKVVIEPLKEGGFSVDVPALPGCITWGHTYEEARDMAKDAIKAYLISLLKHGQQVPVENQEAPQVLDISVHVPAHS